MRTAPLTALLLGMSLLHGCVPLVATGVAGGALSIADRRSTGAQVDDQAIEFRVRSRFKDNFGAAHYHADVTSYNRRVLLTGQAVSEEIRNKMTQLARETPSVVAVTNEVKVGPIATIGTHTNDALVTSNVKARFVTSADGRFSPNHVKVLTEDGTVYLMGIVTPAEGEAAAGIAQTTSGVGGVVKVFEYIDRAP